MQGLTVTRAPMGESEEYYAEAEQRLTAYMDTLTDTLAEEPAPRWVAEKCETPKVGQGINWAYIANRGREGEWYFHVNRNGTVLWLRAETHSKRPPEALGQVAPGEPDAWHLRVYWLPTARAKSLMLDFAAPDHPVCVRVFRTA